MQGNVTPGYGLWLEPLVALAVGTVVIVGLAALAGRLLRTAVWQRTIWQAATVGLLALLVVELTGTASALVRLVHAEREVATRQPGLSTPTAPVEPFHAPTEQPARVPEEPRAELPVKEGQDISVSPTHAPRSQDPAWERTSSKLRFVELQSALARPNPIVVVSNPETPSTSSLEPLVVQPPAADRPSTVATPSAKSNHAWWPGWIWVLGAAAIVSRFVWTHSMLYIFRRRHGVVEDADLHTRVARLARRLGIRRPVTVLEAAGLATPVAFGSFRPTLALPVGFTRDFEPPQQAAIVVHELAHLAAGDPAWQSVADLACAVLWWHPLSWWSRRRLRAANEVAADEASLIIPEGPDALASCLVALGRRLAGRRPRRLGWLAVNGPGFRSALGRRVERLLTLPARSWRTPGRVRCLFTKTTLPVALVIVAILSTAWARSQAAYPEGEPIMNVLSTSWRQSLAATALVAFLGPLAGEAPAQERDRDAAPNLFEAREREARERDRPRAEHPEREIALEQLEVLRLALHALQEAERGDAAELVERAIRAREVSLEGRRDDEANEIRERSPGREQLAEMLGMAADLWREFNNEDKAHAVGQLEAELRGRRDREPGPEHRERGRRDAPDREREEIARHMAELREALGHARREGKEEEAGRIMREMEEIERHVARQKGERRPPDAPHAEEREEVERRMEHIRAAVENLHAAGLHEQAEHLAGQMEHLLHGPPHPDRPHPDMPGHRKGPHPEGLDPVIVEMGNQIRHLNERLEEMGRQMEQQIVEIRRHIEEMGGQVEREFQALGREMDEQLERQHDDDDDDDGDDDDD